MRNLLIRASESEALRRVIMNLGPTRRLAMRFVAGDTVDDALRVCQRLAATGKTITLDYLGESVTDETEARAAAKAYVEIAARMADDTLPAGLSVKPTQLGLHSSAELCAELLSQVAGAAEVHAEHVTLDMEGSDVTEPTVAMVERLQSMGHRHVGCAVQSYLHRTADDVRRLSSVGASLRLCKGAYAESPEIAYQSRDHIDASYAACAEYLLREGTYPRFATHDHRLIRHIINMGRLLRRRSSDYEFQMLFGIRPRLQDQLTSAGYRVRVYIPFGEEWYPYFMRRLAERPANVMFFLRAVVNS